MQTSSKDSMTNCRRTLVSKEDVHKALCCIPLSTIWHGLQDTPMELWKVLNINLYMLLSIWYTGELYKESQLCWEASRSKEKRNKQENLCPQVTNTIMKCFFRSGKVLGTQQLVGSSFSMKVKIFVFESSGDKKQNIKNISTLGTGVLAGISYTHRRHQLFPLLLYPTKDYWVRPVMETDSGHLDVSFRLPLLWQTELNF